MEVLASHWPSGSRSPVPCNADVMTQRAAWPGSQDGGAQGAEAVLSVEASRSGGVSSPARPVSAPGPRGVSGRLGLGTPAFLGLPLVSARAQGKGEGSGEAGVGSERLPGHRQLRLRRAGRGGKELSSSRRFGGWR